MLTHFMARTRMKPLAIDAICGGLALVLVAAAGWFIYRPTLEAASTLKQQTTADNALLDRAAEITRDHAELQQQLADKQQLVKNLAERVPTHAGESEFFGEVARLANKHEVRIHGFRPGASTPGKDYHTVKAEFDASSEYQPLCKFLHGLTNLPRLNHITSMQVELPAPDSKVLTVKISADIYFASPNRQQGTS